MEVSLKSGNYSARKHQFRFVIAIMYCEVIETGKKASFQLKHNF